LTPIQGDVQLFVTRTNLYPSIDKFDKKSEGNVVRYNGMDGSDLNGTYYMAVYGYTSGVYMITPLVVRDWHEMRDSGKFGWQYVQLSEADQ